MKIICGVEYCGQNYGGWQRQADHHRTIQEHIEKALSYVANEPVVIFCAGRTDAGVHATGQVFHFETDVIRPMHGWLRGANTKLPKDIRIMWAVEGDPEFHARFDATARRYHYIISNQPEPSALHYGRKTHVRADLNVEDMHAAAQALVGKHDFTSFRASHCQSKTAIRDLKFINITRDGNDILIDIQANAFLYHMVRNITGSLIEIGKGERPVDWIAELLALRDRSLAAPTAPADGLYLVDVTYPHSF